MNDHVVVALSGGVDSSVTAALLSQGSRQVSAMFMKNWEEDDRLGQCPAEEDARDAAAVCEQLGIRLFTRNFSTEYWDQVFEHFLAEYQAGRTPNPDIACNREIKFKTFMDHASDLGADHIATGHYARTELRDGYWRLLRGVDHNKDQSYFLYTLGQAQLARTLFPLGQLEKPAVRELAAGLDLPVAGKKDSTGICFIGERNFKQFLSQYLPAQPGEIHDTGGNAIAEHDGLMYYTLGQRQGLGIGGTANSNGQPWFVLDKDLQQNILVVGQGHDHPRLFSSQLVAQEITWVSGTAPAAKFSCTAKIRYRQADQECRVAVDGQSMTVDFVQPQRAVTPGQSVVLYAGDECLGGGVIHAMTRVGG